VADRLEQAAETGVVVMGAGLAGLAAAVTLAEAGIDVRVLEAEARVGGRVLTVRSPFDAEVYAEAGGEFVDGGHAVLHRFLQRYGIDVRPIPDGERLFSLDGRILRGADVSDFDARAGEDELAIATESLALAERIGDTERPWESAPDLDVISVGAWLDGLVLGRVTRVHQQIWRSVDYGAPPERLSLLQYARDERLWRRAPELISGRVTGGMDRLPMEMAADLGERVRLSTTVTAVSQDATGVTVRYRGASGDGTVRARFGVLAVPPPALRRIALDPPICGLQRAALENVSMGRITKLMIQVRRRFWEDRGLSGRAFTDGMLQAMYEPTAGLPTERAVLTIYTADRAADTLAAMSDEERRAACLAELERLYPGCSPEVEQIVTVAWDRASRTGGAYSHFQPGEMVPFGPWLDRPHGRLHLAGEHTDQWQATMNGALASGLRAAREILGLLP
jgi:monoamine oxidase